MAWFAALGARTVLGCKSGLGAVGRRVLTATIAAPYFALTLGLWPGSALGLWRALGLSTRSPLVPAFHCCDELRVGHAVRIDVFFVVLIIAIAPLSFFVDCMDWEATRVHKYLRDLAFDELLE